MPACGPRIAPGPEMYEWSPLPFGGGGYMRYIAVNPVNPDVVYAACDVGGMFKTTDGGASWRPILEGFDRASDFAVGSIALYPGNPDIVYIITGRLGEPGSVWRSDDGGSRWTLLNRTLEFDAVGALPVGQRPAKYLLAIDHRNPDVLYVATVKDGICKSVDGGRTFTSVGLAGVPLSGIFMDPVDSRVLYAAAFKNFDDESGGIYKSTDGGAAWQRVREDLDVRCITVDPMDTYILYAACYWDGVYKSTDGGTTWTECNGGSGGRIPARSVEKWYLKVRDRKPTQENIFACIAVDPGRPATVYVTSRGRQPVWRSDDGGHSWQPAPRSPAQIHTAGWWAAKTGRSIYSALHLVVNPANTDCVWLSDSFGVFRSPDRGDNWHPCVNGLENTYIQHIWFDPGNHNTIYLGMNDETFVISRDRGRTFDIAAGLHKQKSSGRINIGNALCIDHAGSPNTLTLATLIWTPSDFQGGVYRSTDDGATWQPAQEGLPNNRVFALAQRPDNPAVLIAGIYHHGLFKTTDGGTSWQACNNGINSPETFYGGTPERADGRFKFRADILMNPGAPDVVYATGGADTGIYKSVDGGETWRSANTGLPQSDVFALRMSAGDADRLYAACGEAGLYASEDGGSRWTLLSSNPCHFVDIFPRDPDIMTAGTLGKLWKSYDGGKHWTDVTLPTILMRLACVRFDPDDANVLFTGTFGNFGMKGVLKQP